MVGDVVEYHDDIQMVITFNGGEEVSRRAYTPEEIAAVTTRNTAEANRTSLTNDAKAAVAELLTSITSLQAVVDKTNSLLGPADTKTVARETRRVARQLVRITRLVVSSLDTTDVGAP